MTDLKLCEKRVMAGLLAVILCAILCLAPCMNAYADETSDDSDRVSNTGTAAGIASEAGLYAYIPFAEGRSVNIQIQRVNGRDYLFLPATMGAGGVVFHYNSDACAISFSDGTPLEPDKVLDITPFLSKKAEDGSSSLSLMLEKGGASSSYEITVMQSANIPSLYISSADASKGISYVDASKSNKAAGALTMLTAAGGIVYDGRLTQIKARGNTTFAEAVKKSYQIKLSVATDLTQKDAVGANKTWILLANAFDPTLIHNTVSYRMAAAFGLDAPDCIPVDLYYDGIYRGNYLLCEKIQVKPGRVGIVDLESKNENANQGKDLDKLPTATGANKYGDIFQYVTGMNNPAFIDGGYLLELDNAYYKGERSFFITSTGQAFVVKSPENCSKEEMIFISEYVEEALRAASNGGISPDTGRSVWEYMDRDSLVKSYVLKEITCNPDVYVSSTYFYLDNNGMPMVSGPVWDYDDSYGVRSDVASAETPLMFGVGFIDVFVSLSEFRQAVRTFYNSAGYSKASNAGIDSAASEIASSQRMNRVIWGDTDNLYQRLGSYDADIAYMKNFAAARAQWLKKAFATW